MLWLSDHVLTCPALKLVFFVKLFLDTKVTSYDPIVFVEDVSSSSLQLLSIAFLCRSACLQE